MKLSPTARAVLTLVATVLAGIVAAIPNETERAAAGALLVALAAVGIVPAHVEDKR